MDDNRSSDNSRPGSRAGNNKYLGTPKGSYQKYANEVARQAASIPNPNPPRCNRSSSAMEGERAPLCRVCNSHIAYDGPCNRCGADFRVDTAQMNHSSAQLAPPRSRAHGVLTSASADSVVPRSVSFRSAAPKFGPTQDTDHTASYGSGITSLRNTFHELGRRLVGNGPSQVGQSSKADVLTITPRDRNHYGGLVDTSPSTPMTSDSDRSSREASSIPSSIENYPERPTFPLVIENEAAIKRQLASLTSQIEQLSSLENLPMIPSELKNGTLVPPDPTQAYPNSAKNPTTVGYQENISGNFPSKNEFPAEHEATLNFRRENVNKNEQVINSNCNNVKQSTKQQVVTPNTSKLINNQEMNSYGQNVICNNAAKILHEPTSSSHSAKIDSINRSQVLQNEHRSNDQSCVNSSKIPPIDSVNPSQMQQNVQSCQQEPISLRVKSTASEIRAGGRVYRNLGDLVREERAIARQTNGIEHRLQSSDLRDFDIPVDSSEIQLSSVDTGLIYNSIPHNAITAESKTGPFPGGQNSSMATEITSDIEPSIPDPVKIVPPPDIHRPDPPPPNPDSHRSTEYVEQRAKLNKVPFRPRPDTSPAEPVVTFGTVIGNRNLGSHSQSTVQQTSEVNSQGKTAQAVPEKTPKQPGEPQQTIQNVVEVQPAAEAVSSVIDPIVPIARPDQVEPCHDTTQQGTGGSFTLLKSSPGTEVKTQSKPSGITVINKLMQDLTFDTAQNKIATSDNLEISCGVNTTTQTDPLVSTPSDWQRGKLDPQKCSVASTTDVVVCNNTGTNTDINLENLEDFAPGSAQTVEKLNKPAEVQCDILETKAVDTVRDELNKAKESHRKALLTLREKLSNEHKAQLEKVEEKLRADHGAQLKSAQNLASQLQLQQQQQQQLKEKEEQQQQQQLKEKEEPQPKSDSNANIAHANVGTSIEWGRLIEAKRVEIHREMSLKLETPAKFSRGIGNHSVTFSDATTDTEQSFEALKQSILAEGLAGAVALSVTAAPEVAGLNPAEDAVDSLTASGTSSSMSQASSGVFSSSEQQLSPKDIAARAKASVGTNTEILSDVVGQRREHISVCDNCKCPVVVRCSGRSSTSPPSDGETSTSSPKRDRPKLGPPRDTRASALARAATAGKMLMAANSPPKTNGAQSPKRSSTNLKQAKTKFNQKDVSDAIPESVPRSAGDVISDEDLSEASDKLAPLPSDAPSVAIKRSGRTPTSETETDAQQPPTESPLTSETSEEDELSLEEGSYDTAGRISNTCDLNGQADYDKPSVTPQFRDACELLLAHQTKTLLHLKAEDVTNATNIVRHDWLRTAARRNARADVVDLYLDTLESYGMELMQSVVNMTDTNLNTALHYAVSHCHFDIVSVLLDSKVCDVNKPNKAGYTPVMLAALCTMESDTDRSVLQRLFQIGDVNLKAVQNEQTALMLAASHGNVGNADLLIDMGACINIRDRDGSTALMCATEHGHADVIRFLLDHPDIDVAAEDNDGSCALSIAVENEFNDIAGILRQYLDNMAPDNSTTDPSS